MNEFEIEILNWIQEHVAGHIPDVFFGTVTHLGDGGILWILLTLLLLIFPRTRRCGAVMAVSLILNALVVNVVLKPLVERVRPYDVNPMVQLLIAKPWDYSFPSGHTASSFAAASALLFEKNKAWKWAMLLAGILAYSRLYLYVHYPTDVLAGAVIGVAAGWAAAKIVAWCLKNKNLERGKNEDDRQ